LAAYSSPHPSDEALWRYGQGQLDATDAVEVSQHLEECADCRKRQTFLTARDLMAAHSPTCPMDEDALGKTRPSGMTRTDPAGTPEAPTLPNQRFHELAQHPDYEIVRELGRGGMGVVYLAHNKLLGRDEVLKVLDLDVLEHTRRHDRFQREIRAVARLRHPNIVAAYSAFRSGENLVFAMEHVEGLDLARMVRAKGPMPITHACYFVYQAALGLEHAHEEGMVHRDIKPGNLMLSHSKGRAIIKVLDFGLAKANCELLALDLRRADLNRQEEQRGDLTLAGQMLGTPEYIAPEQIDDAQKADIRADIYSLGCTLYYLLSGHPPFQKATLLEVVIAHRFEIPTPLDQVRPEVPSELAGIVAKMLEKDPEHRFQTPAEVAVAVMPFFKKRTGASTPPKPASAAVYTLTHNANSPQRASSELPSPLAPVAQPPRDGLQSDSVWENLIEIEEPELDSSDGAGGAISTTRQGGWRVPMVSTVGMIVGILLVAGLVVLAFVRNRPEIGADTQTAVESPDAIAGHTYSNLNGGEIERLGQVAAPAGGAADNSAASIAAQNESALEPESNSAVVAAATVKAAPGGEPSSGAMSAGAASIDRERKPDLNQAVAKPMPPLINSPRWEWIHDVSLPVFDRWVDNLRERGYRPFFVNGHDLASRVKLKKAPDVAGEVRIAAVAVREEHPVPFQVELDAEKDAFSHFRQRVARGYQLSAQTTFTNGTLPFVLAVYTEGMRGGGFWFLSSDKFPGDYVNQWHTKGVRPVEVAGRPAGDFWKVTLATINSNGVDWKVRTELSLAELHQTLVDAKASGFRPESLFVCPGRARGGFGVVLTHDKANVLWEVHADLTPGKLESDLPRMAERGYSPEQIVGYIWAGVSHYAVCWTRHPDQYPATGLTDRVLEPLDIALEHFLIEHRIPAATLAVYRNERLAISRGYGHADQKTREPISPAAVMSLGDLSTPIAAAAVYSLIRRNKLADDAPLSDVLSATKVDAAKKRQPDGSGSQPSITVGKLLKSFDPSAPPFDENDRNALVALAGSPKSSPTESKRVTDQQLPALLLGRILEAVASKPAIEAITSELGHLIRVAHAATGEIDVKKSMTLDDLVAPATEVGRFFVKNQFDGRPLSGRVKTAAGAMIVRRGSSIAVIARHGDLLAVVMLDLLKEAPQQLGDELRACVDRALDSPPPLTSMPGKRKSPPR
jgi:serine/threonine protein kinase